MYALITIFYVSFIVMVAMIWLKGHEVKTGRRTIVSSMGQGTDHAFNAAYLAIKRFFSYFDKKTAIAVGHWFAYHVLLRIRRIYIEIKHRFIMNPHGRRLLDAVRGRGEVRNHGASFYLRRIADGK